jgi:hypothetical protein
VTQRCDVNVEACLGLQMATESTTSQQVTPSRSRFSREPATREYKVVHMDSRESSSGTSVIVTLEGHDGETLDVDLPAGSTVTRSLESKWESADSPTPHEDR